MYTVYTSSYSILLCMIFVTGMVGRIHMEAIHLCEPVLLVCSVQCNIIHQMCSIDPTPKYVCIGF